MMSKRRNIDYITASFSKLDRFPSSLYILRYDLSVVTKRHRDLVLINAMLLIFCIVFVIGLTIKYRLLSFFSLTSN